MNATLNGPWDIGQVQEYLANSNFPLRLACVGGDGYPRVVSVWYFFDGEQLHCASHGSSPLVSLLQNEPRVGFEVAPNEPPYQGVRGQGVATLAAEGGGVMLEQLLQRYLGDTKSGLAQWLLSRSEEEMLISIRPERLFSWDYTGRMS